MSIWLFVHSCDSLSLSLSVDPGWVRLATTSIQSFVNSCDSLSLSPVELGLRRWTFDCLFILATLSLSLSVDPGWARLATKSIWWFVHSCDSLSLPPGWVRLATMRIWLFVHSCDSLPLLLVELGLRRWAFDCLFILATSLSSSWLSLAYDDERPIVCSFLGLSLFLLVELSLRRMSIQSFVHSCDSLSLFLLVDF